MIAISRAELILFGVLLFLAGAAFGALCAIGNPDPAAPRIEPTVSETEEFPPALPLDPIPSPTHMGND